MSSRINQPKATWPNPKPDSAWRRFLGYTSEQLAVTDPVETNLCVAKGIPSLANLEIVQYKHTLDKWATEIKRGLRDAESQFHETPHHWKNDLNFFRLGFLCYFVDEVLGIRYREDQRDLQSVSYTDASDLFLNGVIDTKRGTCANMAALHVALGWRLRWPVALACVGAHIICRYDDGKVTHNIEATKNGGGGFHSHPDEYYLYEHRLPEKAVASGSDLRALTPTEMLGVFIGLRARHFVDTNRNDLAETDYLFARALFPNSRHLHFVQTMASLQYALNLFDLYEAGHPLEVSAWLRDMLCMEPWKRQPLPNPEEFSFGSNRKLG